MLFRERIKNPGLLMTIGMMFLVIGMMFLVIALTLPRTVLPAAFPGPIGFDGLRGLLFGIAIGFNLMAVVFAALRRRPSAT
jgi:hypothetical protein